jgi:hypothetical protein
MMLEIASKVALLLFSWVVVWKAGHRYGLAKARDMLAAKVAKRIERDDLRTTLRRSGISLPENVRRSVTINGVAKTREEFDDYMRTMLDGERREIQKGLS